MRTYDEQLTAEADRWADHVTARLVRRSWLQSPVVVRYMNRRVSGDPNVDWFQWVNRRFLEQTARETALSIGCNDGEFERALVTSGAVRALEGMDVSAPAIAAAQAAADREQVNARFSVADVNKVTLAPERYDIVLAVMAMHHFVDLEHVLDEVDRALKPSGYFVLNEYVGASRFQWPIEQTRLATEVLHLLSPRRRRLRDGSLREIIVAPPLADMDRTDPFEAVRSSEIIPLVEKRLHLVARRDYGGSILHPMLHDIIHNFDDDEESDREMLEMLCGVEELLVREGTVGNDFSVVVAQRRMRYYSAPRGGALHDEVDLDQFSADSTVFAEPRNVDNLADCYFYHTVDLPGHGVMTGAWDLRGVEEQYLGGVRFEGKRVLEIGAASGFLTMYMEQQGADVVAYDLSDQHSWDIVPFAGIEYGGAVQRRKDHQHRLNNSFWLTHRLSQSRSRMVYGTVYDIPSGIGSVDIATFGSVLLYLRDPFLALQNALRLIRETVIVTDLVPERDRARIAGAVATSNLTERRVRQLTYDSEPHMRFLPQFWDRQNGDVWWELSPAIIQRFMGVLGFEQSEVTYHFAQYQGNPALLYTVVGKRTKPPALGHGG